MPGRMKALVFDYSKKQHALAKGIELEEMSSLVDALRQRFVEASEQLDLSLQSLQRLSDVATIYARQVNIRSGPLSDREHLQIIRELAAYIGSVLLRGLNAEWDNPGGLLNVGVVVKGGFEAVKGTEKRRSNHMVANIGYMAAGVWDAALSGTPTDMMRAYQLLTGKRVVENLKSTTSRSGGRRKFT